MRYIPSCSESQGNMPWEPEKMYHFSAEVEWLKKKKRRRKRKNGQQKVKKKGQDKERGKEKSRLYSEFQTGCT